MQTQKPRNYVALALSKRNGAGVHDKTNKAKRQKLKRMLQKELREPPTYLGGFSFNTHILGGFIYPYKMYSC